MCLNETYSKHLLDIFPVKNGLKRRFFITIVFQLCSGICIRRVHANQEGLKLNDTHQLLVYADVVNILSGNIHTKGRTQKL